MKTVIISSQNSPCRCGPTSLHQLPLPRCGPWPPGHWGFHLGWLRARWCLPPIELLSLSLTHPPMNGSSLRRSSCAVPGCEVTLAPPSSPSSRQPQGLQCPSQTSPPAQHCPSPAPMKSQLNVCQALQSTVPILKTRTNLVPPLRVETLCWYPPHQEPHLPTHLSSPAFPTPVLTQPMALLQCPDWNRVLLSRGGAPGKGMLKNGPWKQIKDYKNKIKWVIKIKNKLPRIIFMLHKYRIRKSFTWVGPLISFYLLWTFHKNSALLWKSMTRSKLVTRNSSH